MDRDYLITLFVKRTLTVSISGVTSQRTENASLSTLDLRLQMSSVNGLGSMSILLVTRYVVVALRRMEASLAGANFAACPKTPGAVLIDARRLEAALILDCTFFHIIPFLHDGRS